MAPRKRLPGAKLREKQYVEDALQLVRRKIPRLVYLPARLRGHNQYVSLDNLQVRISGPQIIDNHARIQEADPLGFMIATMHGLPIPRFEIKPHAHSAHCPADCEGIDPNVVILYHTPTPAEQRAAARWLGTRVTFPTPGAYREAGAPTNSGHSSANRRHAHDYDAMIAAAAGQLDEEDDDLPDPDAPQGTRLTD